MYIFIIFKLIARLLLWCRVWSPVLLTCGGAPSWRTQSHTPSPPASVPHRPCIRCCPGQSQLRGPGLSFLDSTVSAMSKGPCSASCAPEPRNPHPGIVWNSQELPVLDFVCRLHPCAQCRVSYCSLSLLSCLECTLAQADSMRIRGKTLQLADETVSLGGWATWGLNTAAVLSAPFPHSWFSFPSVLSCR